MLNKYSTLILGAVMGISTLAFSGAGASAAAMLPLSPLASGEANAGSDAIVQVNHRKNIRRNMSGFGDWNGNNWNGNNRRFNNRCSYNYGGCRHYRRNNHFNNSYLYLPLIIGGGFGAYNYYDDGYGDGYGYAGVSSRHVRWCLNRYRSYNPRNNLWRAYSGKKYQCNSPYY